MARKSPARKSKDQQRYLDRKKSKEFSKPDTIVAVVVREGLSSYLTVYSTRNGKSKLWEYKRFRKGDWVFKRTRRLQIIKKIRVQNRSPDYGEGSATARSDKPKTSAAIPGHVTNKKFRRSTGSGRHIRGRSTSTYVKDIKTNQYEFVESVERVSHRDMVERLTKLGCVIPDEMK